jgi:hypothetical protein
MDENRPLSKKKVSKIKTESKEKELTKLKKQWYQILKSEYGFEDIEYFDAKMRPLYSPVKRDQLSNNINHGATPLKLESNYNYFEKAAYHLNHFFWTNKLEEQIWEMHTNLKSSRTIGKELGIDRKVATRIITKHVKLMQETYCSPPPDELTELEEVYLESITPK